MEFDEFKHTHNGKMFGIPVYLDMRCEECPQVDADWWWIPFLFVAEVLFAMFCFAWSIMNPEFEPRFPIQVGKEVDQ